MMSTSHHISLLVKRTETMAGILRGVKDDVTKIEKAMLGRFSHVERTVLIDLEELNVRCLCN